MILYRAAEPEYAEVLPYSNRLRVAQKAYFNYHNAKFLMVNTHLENT